MAEIGNIEFDVGVNHAGAVQGFQIIGKAVNGIAKDSQKFGKKFKQAANEVQGGARQIGSAVVEGSEDAIEGLEELQDAAHDTGDVLEQTAERTGMSFAEMGELAGDLDSGLKAMAGGVDLVNEEMGALMSQVGDIAGAFEGATRMAGNLNDAYKKVGKSGMVLLGGVGLLAAGFLHFRNKAKAARAALEEQHQSMKVAAQEAKAYQMRLMSLRHSVGLVASTEHALAQARAGAEGMMSNQTDSLERANAVAIVAEKVLRKNEAALRGLIEPGGAQVAMLSDMADFNAMVNEQMATGTFSMRANAKALRTSASNWREYGDAMERVSMTSNQVVHETAIEETKRFNRGLRSGILAMFDMKQEAKDAANTQAIYSDELENNSILIMAQNALTSDNIDIINQAINATDGLSEAERGVVRLKLENWKASLLQAQAAERAANAASHNKEAEEEFAEVVNAANDVLERAATLREAIGDTAYASWIRSSLHVQKLVQDEVISVETANELKSRSFAQYLRSLEDQESELEAILRGPADIENEILNEREGALWQQLATQKDVQNQIAEAQKIALRAIEDEQSRLNAEIMMLYGEQVDAAGENAEAITAARQRMQDKIDEVESSAVNKRIAVNAASERAMTANAERGAEERNAIREEEYQAALAEIQDYVSKAQSFTSSITGFMQAQAELQSQELEQELNRRLESEAAHRERFLEAARGDADKRAELEEKYTEQFGTEQERQQEITKQFNVEMQDEQRRIFELRQKAKIAETISAGALAIIQAYAELGPVAGTVAAAFIGATTGTSLGIIAGQESPYHQGGMISGQGDQMIKAQGGEAVLNKSAVNSMGGASAVESLNSGRGSGQPVVIELTYKQKVLDRVVADSLRKGGPLKNALNKSKRAGKRGRVGGRL